MMVGLLLRDTVIPVLVAEVPTPRLSALGVGLEAGVATAMLIPEVACPAETFTAVGLVAPLVTELLVPVVVAGPVPPPQPALRMIKTNTKMIPNFHIFSADVRLRCGVASSGLLCWKAFIRASVVHCAVIPLGCYTPFKLGDCRSPL
jgi:hypothetical protein